MPEESSPGHNTCEKFNCDFQGCNDFSTVGEPKVIKEVNLLDKSTSGL